MTDAPSSPASDRRPAFVRAFAAVAALEGLSVYERAAVTSAIAWVNFETGELWPAKTTWARQAGMSERQLYKVLADLERRGIAARTTQDNKGGRGNVTAWRFAVLAVDRPEGSPDANPAQAVQGLGQLTAPKPCTPNTVSDERKPCTRRANPAPQVGNPAHGVTNPAQLVQTNSPEQPSTPTEPGRVPVDSSSARYSRSLRARATDDPPGFRRFAAAYPAGRFGNPAVSRGVWDEMGAESEADRIVAAVEKLRKSAEWTREEGRFIPMAPKFLSERKFEAVAVAKPSKLGEIATDAQQQRFKAWWAAKTEPERAAFAARHGTAAGVIDGWVAWKQIRTAMVST